MVIEFVKLYKESYDGVGPVWIIVDEINVHDPMKETYAWKRWNIEKNDNQSEFLHTHFKSESDAKSAWNANYNHEALEGYLKKLNPEVSRVLQSKHRRMEFYPVQKENAHYRSYLLYFDEKAQHAKLFDCREHLYIEQLKKALGEELERQKALMK